MWCPVSGEICQNNFCLISTLLKTIIHYIPSCQRERFINALYILWPVSPTDTRSQRTYEVTAMKWRRGSTEGLTTLLLVLLQMAHFTQNKMVLILKLVYHFLLGNFIWWCEIHHQETTRLMRRHSPNYRNADNINKSLTVSWLKKRKNPVEVEKCHITNTNTKNKTSSVLVQWVCFSDKLINR